MLDVPTSMRRALNAARDDGTRTMDEWLLTHLDPSKKEATAFARSAIDPPPAGRERERDLVAVARTRARTTPENDSASWWFAEHGYPRGPASQTSIWSRVLRDYRQHAIDTLGPKVGAEAAHRVYDAYEDAISIADRAVNDSKHDNPEARPYVTLTIWDGKPNFESHPSGHAADAYAAATVLGSAWPERRSDFDDLAAMTAHSRIVGAWHYPHDAVTGARIGAMAGVAALARHVLWSPDGS